MTSVQILEGLRIRFGGGEGTFCRAIKSTTLNQILSQSRLSLSRGVSGERIRGRTALLSSFLLLLLIDDGQHRQTLAGERGTWKGASGTGKIQFISGREIGMANEPGYPPVRLHIHSSSINSFAVLRFSGSHCSILRMRRRKASLSPCPISVVSLSSRAFVAGKGIGAQNSPVLEKNSLLRFPRASRLGGGGPRSATISARWARLRYAACSGSRPLNSCSPSNMCQI
jgi:hypothetical protein